MKGRYVQLLAVHVYSQRGARGVHGTRGAVFRDITNRYLFRFSRHRSSDVDCFAHPATLLWWPEQYSSTSTLMLVAQTCQHCGLSVTRQEFNYYFLNVDWI